MQNKKKSTQKILALLTGMIILLSLNSCEKDDTPATENNTITDVVSKNNNFSILKSAVIKADLAATLSGAGPFTVFAPDDNAFGQAGITTTVINTLSQANIAKILLYHTIGAKVMAAQVPAGPNAAVATAGGDSVYLTSNVNGVFVKEQKLPRLT